MPAMRSSKWYHLLHRGKLTSTSFKAFVDSTGLKLVDKDGGGTLDREEIAVLADFFTEKPMSEAQIDEAMAEMDDDNSGTISKDEYIQFIDKKCASDPDFHASFTSHCRSAKLGYDGTTWRNHANIDWLSSQGVLILMWLSILAAIIYFRFILVPLDSF